MNVSYFDPLTRAWNRMTTALFKPFDIGKWFVVGFTAFLAQLMDWPEGGSDNEGKWHTDMDGFVSFPDVVREWFTDNPGLFTLIIFGLVVVLAIIILLTWLSSRGKFMFLENVVHNSAVVAKPWHQYRTEGNSLFVWRILYGLICVVAFSLVMVQCYQIVVDIYYDGFSVDEHLLRIIGMALLALALIIVSAYISLFLNDFVVPIMYKNNTTTTQAWNQFLSILTHHWLSFILYGLFILVLYIGVVAFVVIAGLVTCCLGFLLLIIPYISSVILLPISYTFRSFSLEFLEQFGPEFVIFPRADDSAAS